MTASNELSSQALLLLMIFFIITTLGLAFAIHTIHSGWQVRVDSARSDLEEVQNRANSALERTEERNIAWNLITGEMRRPHPETVRERHFRAAGQALDDVRETLHGIPGSEDAARSLQENVSCPQSQPVADASGDSAVPYYVNGAGASFQTVTLDLAAILDAVRPLIHDLRDERDSERVRGLVTEDNTREQLESIARDREGLRGDLSQALDRINDLRADRDRLQREHLAEVKEQQEAIQEVRDGAEADRQRLQAQITSLEERIAELEARRAQTLAETTADGAVVHADADEWLAWIDLTAEDGLRVGDTFEVFQFIKGGEKVIKGVIEVRELGEEVSEVAIVESHYMRNPETGEMRPLDGPSAPVPSDWERVVLPLADNPVIQGDFIRSPFFDPDEEPTFVFVGSRITNPQYGLSDLRQRIEETGGSVDDQVTIETDFAVILEDAEATAPEEFQKAIQFGVVIMREPDLLEYLDRRR